jgi:hypothetical protein
MKKLTAKSTARQGANYGRGLDLRWLKAQIKDIDTALAGGRNHRDKWELECEKRAFMRCIEYLKGQAGRTNKLTGGL